MDAPVLRHGWFKIDGDAHILSAAKIYPTVCGFWRYKSYADIRRRSLVRWCQMRVRSSKMRVLFFDCYIYRMKFPTGFTCRNLHGFSRFPGDSTALVITRYLLSSRSLSVRNFKNTSSSTHKNVQSEFGC